MSGSTVTISGAGNMGTAIDAVLSAGGATVQHITSSTAAEVPVDGDLVILAVPYQAFDAIVASLADQLAGKIVLEVTNPLDFATMGSLVPAGNSATSELARALPNSRVLKGFNTNVAQTLTPGGSAVVLIAGDDAEAKETVINAITAGNLSALDAGGLDTAEQLEAVGAVQVKLVMGGKAAGLQVVPTA